MLNPLNLLSKFIKSSNQKELDRIAKIVDQVKSFESFIQQLPDEDFPEMSSGEMPCGFSIDSDNLARLIDKAKFAISTEETRYYLNGIFLHSVDNELRSVATDGHRLACIKSDLPAGAEDIPSIIIPRKTVGEVRKLIEDSSGTLDIKVSDTKIQFNFNDIQLTSKLIDGINPKAVYFIKYEFWKSCGRY